MKEYSQNIGRNTDGGVKREVPPPMKNETVVYTAAALRRLQNAEKAGVDGPLLRGIRYSLEATAQQDNGGHKVVDTKNQNFQFGILAEAIKGKSVRPGEQRIRPKGSR